MTRVTLAPGPVAVDAAVRAAAQVSDIPLWIRPGLARSDAPRREHGVHPQGVLIEVTAAIRGETAGRQEVQP